MGTLGDAMAGFLVAAVISGTARSEAPSTPGQLPPLTGKTLNSRSMTLPQDLPADPSLVFIAFDQDQQGQIDSWTHGLKESPTVPWLELPIIEQSNAFVRTMIADGMRRDIKASAIRERVLTVYTDPEAVAHAVGCTDYRKRLCVAVVERSGRIRLVLTGAYSAEAGARALENMGSTERGGAPTP